MKPRHAAALALVGWYLMTPPPEINPVTHLRRLALSAPFGYWQDEGSFDSAKECNAALESNIKWHMQVAAKIYNEHRSDQQESTLDEQMDQVSNSPKGFSHGLRHYGLTAAENARCIASDDPRLKEK
jgi:hypothetical protein